MLSHLKTSKTFAGTSTSGEWGIGELIFSQISLLVFFWFEIPYFNHCLTRLTPQFQSESVDY